MATIFDLQDRGLRHGVIVDAAATTASLADLERAGLRYKVEVASGITAADRAILDRRGLQYFVPVAVGVTAADKAALDRQGLRYAVQVDADILPADRIALEQQGLSYFVEVDSSGNSVAPGAGGGAALLTDETNGFATDFTYATDANRVAVKTAGVVVSSGLDAFFQNAGTSPKQVFDVTGALVWSPHNMVLQSQTFNNASWTKSGATVGTDAIAAPDGTTTADALIPNAGSVLPYTNQTVSVVTGATYTGSVYVKNGTLGTPWFQMALISTTSWRAWFNLSTGAKGSSLNSPVSYNITSVGSGWYKVDMTIVAGTTGIQCYLLTSPSDGNFANNVTGDGTSPSFYVWGAQVNRGTVPTTYLPTTTAARYGLAIDYDPVTHAAKGLLVEPAATNLLLNNTTLSTQSVTVTAVAHTLSFLGTGTVTLTGTSTAGPLVGTGASNRVSLTFTPTAGSLTLTVTGTVSNAQLETGAVATSPIPTFAATQTRAGDNYTFLLSTIPALGSQWSLYCRYATPSVSSGRHVVAVTDGTLNEFVGLRTNVFPNLNVVDGGVNQVNQNNGTLVADTFISTAARIKLNDFSMSSNGLAVTGDVAATLPTVTEVRFGGTGNNGVAVGLYRIQKLMLVPRGWSDVELVAKSAT